MQYMHTAACGLAFHACASAMRGTTVMFRNKPPTRVSRRLGPVAAAKCCTDIGCSARAAMGPAYVRATRCPEEGEVSKSLGGQASNAICLRACYARPGTDLAYAGISLLYDGRD
eukprot:3941443-Rhodomonas_salina.3